MTLHTIQYDQLLSIEECTIITMNSQKINVYLNVTFNAQT